MSSYFLYIQLLSRTYKTADVQTDRALTLASEALLGLAISNEAGILHCGQVNYTIDVLLRSSMDVFKSVFYRHL